MKENPANPAALPEFWIDVGGTFTDCIARLPDGTLRTHKLLSTGRYPTHAHPDTDSTRWLDDAFQRAPAGYFTGYTLRCLLPVHGWVERRITKHHASCLWLADPLPAIPPSDAPGELFSTEEAPVSGIRYLLGLPLSAPIGPVRVRLGTTRATNALLERRGARTALVATAGFADALRIGYQDRPHLFDLRIDQPPELYETAVEIPERLAASGSVLLPLDESATRATLTALRANGIESLAVCLLHAYRNPAHECTLGQIAAKLGFAHVSLSHQVSALPKLIYRGDTTVLDAYLTPVLRTYCRRLAAQLPGADLRFMTSAGSLVPLEQFSGKDAILSGPAGGVVGFARIADRAEQAPAFAFDMGGTSTDVSRWDGQAFARRYETDAGGSGTVRRMRLQSSMLEIETVAAGGGSVCWFDGQKPAVGPRSAGADPGPASYGRGGPLTVTDLNVYLGRIPRFPFPLDLAAVESRLDELITAIAATGKTYTRDELAAGFLRIANAAMVAPIKRLAATRGDDVRTHTLVAFGGAGGQHACALARELGMTRILCSPHAGVLSALGIGLAGITRFAEQALAPGDDPTAVFTALETTLRARLAGEGIPTDRLAPPRRTLEMRYRGQETRLPVPEPPDCDFPAAFTREHQRLFNFTFPTRPIENYAARVELSTLPTPLPDTAVPCVCPSTFVCPPEQRESPSARETPSTAESTRNPIPQFCHPEQSESASVDEGTSGWRQPNVAASNASLSHQTHHNAISLLQEPNPSFIKRVWYIDSDWQDTNIYERHSLTPGTRLSGPAIILEPVATVVVEPGWTVEVTPHDDLLLTATSATNTSPATPANYSGVTAHFVGETGVADEVDDYSGISAHFRADPVELELFHHRFASVAEQMGAVLQRTALSTNVKERLDFSCALFDADGSLIANAAHIPVHLGAMQECVRCLREDVPGMRPGEVYITNDPFRGGSHLPDVTVVTPVFTSDSSLPAFFTASRAHHAEIGGITPGSLPPGATSLAEEGVLIRAFRYQAADPAASDTSLRALLLAGPYPTRSVEENLADLHAQIAANQTGVTLLAELIARHSLPSVAAYAEHLQRGSENRLRAALHTFARQWSPRWPADASTAHGSPSPDLEFKPAGRVTEPVVSQPEGNPLSPAPSVPPPSLILHPSSFASSFRDTLDDGTPIAVAITVRADGSATFDFTGSGPVHPGNLNANRAITASAVIYCLRCLLGEPVPLNAGLLAPVEIIIPPGSLLDPPGDPDPRRCPAVGGGNVETSQRLVDVILGALGLVAASQGTMNNFLFGRGGPDAFGYYETIGGGSGAGPGFDGASAVHVHMTNTRLTDPEALETRYPVRLREWSIRHGSGGAGRHRGGDGMVRELEFLAPLSVSLLTNRRLTAPYGIAGGAPGQPGRNLLRRSGETAFTELPPAGTIEVHPGDILRLETPGGGGWGSPA